MKGRDKRKKARKRREELEQRERERQTTVSNCRYCSGKLGVSKLKRCLVCGKVDSLDSKLLPQTNPVLIDRP